MSGRYLVLGDAGEVVNVIVSEAAPPDGDGLTYVEAAGDLALAGPGWTVIGGIATPPLVSDAEPDTAASIAAEMAALQARLAALLEQGT